MTYRVLCCCLLTVALAGCSKKDENNTTPPVSTETIGPEGGEVVLPDGAGVTIPEGALAEDLGIGVGELSAADTTRLAATLDPSVVLVSSLYAFTPHGTSFSTDVDITIPYDNTRDPAADGLKVMRLDDEDDETWEEVSGASYESGDATFATNSFSVIGVVANAGTVANNDAGPSDMGGGGMDTGGSDTGGGGDMGTASAYANLPGTWTITQSIGGGGTPHVSMNASGDAIVAWSELNTFFLSERTSGTWSHPADATDFRSTSDSEFGRWTTTGIADNGDAVINFNSSGSTGFVVYRSTRTGGVWTHPTGKVDRVDFPTETASHSGHHSHVKMAPDGSGFMAWTYINAGIYGAFGSGDTWSQPTDTVADALNVGGSAWAQRNGLLEVAVVNGGKAMVAYRQEDADGDFVNVSTYNGSWTRGMRIDSVPGSQRERPYLAMGDNGDAILAWTGTSGWEGCLSCSVLHVSEYTSGTWTHPTDGEDYFNLGGAPGAASISVGNDSNAGGPEVQLAITDNGDAVVIYRQWVNGDEQIFVAERKSGVWTKPGIDDYIPFPAGAVDISDWRAAISPTGDIAVVVYGLPLMAGGITQPMVAHRIDGVWYVPESGADGLDFTQTGLNYPSLAISASGEVIFVGSANDGTLSIAEFTPQ